MVNKLTNKKTDGVIQRRRFFNLSKIEIKMTKQEKLPMEDLSLPYEYLIRRAHHCGRYGVDGADADTYRRFERAIAIYNTELDNIEKKQPRIRTASLEELFSDYKFQAGRISAYVSAAINFVMRERQNSLSDSAYQELEDILLLLNEQSAASIYDAINRGNKQLAEIGLSPG